MTKYTVEWYEGPTEDLRIYRTNMSVCPHCASWNNVSILHQDHGKSKLRATCSRCGCIVNLTTPDKENSLASADTG